jgi:hypothetical protein
MAARRRQAKADDGYARETFTQPREQVRQTARAFLNRWPAAAYMPELESWRELPDGEIEFTMKRLRSTRTRRWESSASALGGVAISRFSSTIRP